MNIASSWKTTVLATAILATPAAFAAGLSDDEYKAGQDRLTATYKVDRERCGSLSGNAKDICVEEAKGREKVARAELEFNRSGKPEDREKAMIARADATQAVAQERCDDLAGNPKDVCRKEAKAAHTKAVADAKLGRTVGDAQSDATKQKVDADYDVAKERCDTLAGDAKSRCVDDAKQRFGKS